MNLISLKKNFPECFILTVLQMMHTISKSHHKFHTSNQLALVREYFCSDHGNFHTLKPERYAEGILKNIRPYVKHLDLILLQYLTFLLLLDERLNKRLNKHFKIFQPF